MAEQASNEATAHASQMADQNTIDSAPGQDAGLISAPTAPEMSIPTFQAINAKAVVGNASTSVNTADQGRNAPGPPPQGTAVTQPAPRKAQSPTELPLPTIPPPQLDGTDDAMAVDATYGTRSRNKTGNARPNYAEDQEMDFEYSSSTTTKKKPAAESADPTQSTSEVKRAREFAHLIGGSTEGTPSSAHDPANKESTPVSNPSKKRKAAGPPVMSAQLPPAANSPLPSASRKVAAQPSTARETNVMTFTKHKSCLNKKGELTADDGTKLSANGKSWRSPDKG